MYIELKSFKRKNTIMGNIYKALFTLSLVLFVTGISIGQTEVINHFQKYRESEVLDSYKSDVVDVTIMTEYNCRTYGEFYYDLSQDPVYKVDGYIRYAVIKKFGNQGWVAMVKKRHADDIGGNLIDIVYTNDQGAIDHKAFSLDQEFDFNSGKFYDFTVVSANTLATISDEGQRIYFYNIDTEEVTAQDVDLPVSIEHTLDYLPNQTYVVVSSNGIHMLDTDYSVLGSLPIDLSGGFQKEMYNDSLLFIMSDNYKYVFDVNTKQLINQYASAPDQNFISLDIVDESMQYLLSQVGDQQILELLDQDNNTVTIDIPSRANITFDRVTANTNDYELYGSYNRFALEQEFNDWPQRDDSLATIIYHSSTQTGLVNTSEFSIEISDTYRTLDTIEVREDENGELIVITAELFNFTCTLTNNGTEKIDDVSFFSNGGRAFNCGHHYFRDEHLGIDLAPGASYSFQSVKYIPHYFYQQFCLYANSANNILDLDPSDNEVCIDVLDSPIKNGLVDDGKIWNVSFFDYWNGNIRTKRFKYSNKDTLIDEQVYRQLLESDEEIGDSYTGTRIFYRNSGDKVYAYDLGEAKEYLVYDFGLDVGEVFRSNIFDDDTQEGLLVTAIDSITLDDGSKRKRLQLSCLFDGETQEGWDYYWIEGIGSDYGVQLKWGYCYFDAINSRLQCYYEDEQLTYQPQGQCWLVPTTDLVYQDLSIYPNPASDRLQIITEEAVNEVQIINTQGQLIMQGSDKVINIEALPQGVYMIKVTNEEGAFNVQQFVKL